MSVLALMLQQEATGEGAVEKIARTFGVYWPHLTAQLVSFAIVCAALYWLAYKPVLRMLEARRQQIATGLANTEKINAALANIESQRQSIMAEAQAQSAKLIAEARDIAKRLQEQEAQRSIATAEQIMAKAAVLNQDRWHLSNVLVYYRDNLPPNRLDQMIYSGSFRPAAAGARSGDPEEMSMGDLGYFIENSGFGIRPTWVYQTWWHKRLTFFVTALAMVALCIPLAVRFRRGGGIGVMFAVGIGLGFIFFIVDGISLTMGELGFVTPWFAAWAPVLGLAAVAGLVSFRTEHV